MVRIGVRLDRIPKEAPLNNRYLALIGALIAAPAIISAQAPPAVFQPWLDSLAHAPQADRIEADIRALVGFGTRHTASDTISTTRGIGAARRWIHGKFEQISAECGGCLDVRYLHHMVKGNPRGRLIHDTDVISVIAIQWGTTRPDNWVVMSGDIDSRASDVRNDSIDAPGANDNASGMSGAIEAARVLSRRKFPNTIVYAGLAGEEQGLYGGQALAQQIADSGWKVIGVFNNDMIGNIAGINGVVSSRDFRIFSEPVAVGQTDAERRAVRSYGGEADGPSRQLARKIDELAQRYLPNLRPKLIYRLDRFGRGGHHRPFNDLGMPAVRIMEAHENYDRQHQDVRTENGREFGDVIEYVNFDYVARLTGVNVVALADLAAAPPPPAEVRIAGAVSADTRLRWVPVEAPDLAGYRIYWRDTDASRWNWNRFIPRGTDRAVLEGIIIDDYLFGVASVGTDGSESVVRFPTFTR